MLTRIQAQLPHLSKSERLVGSWILANPMAALEQDTRSLAQQIDVSQPTLVRFARSLGCDGFQDFRMRLARSLGEARAEPPTTLLSIAQSPDVATLAHKLFDFSAHALLQVRDTLDMQSLEAAIDALDRTAKVDFFGFGHAVSVAQDAMRRFMRLELQVAACTDSHLQSLAAAQLRAGDVAVLISQTGRSPELQQVLSAAKVRGATCIALTTSNSPLEAAGDIALCIDIPDSGDALTPATAQLAQLLVIDILAIGVAARRSARIAESVTTVRPKPAAAKKGTAPRKTTAKGAPRR
ncbi:MurR/RpiR family transcriptional regulator [Piscinibacter terrae]|uniref:MurR/RpiR family transcriptional regulator n=1 Tax=Piscinibacter terrae TaxID=2496871 RepID=A0A3N7HRQ2_9BURK|nr:MurR/RpiR family transcriptional regulator [Albitalea terrae]RQP24413.1 MurR/RpiR family transcriptional regulator [Albitalea terrae]